MLLSKSNMAGSNNILLIIEIITIVISGFTLVISGLSLYFSYRANKMDRRSANYREIIAKQRLREYNQIREFLSNFLWSIRNYIRLASEDSKILYEKAYLQLYCQFKPQYDEDIEILTCMEKIDAIINPLSDNKTIQQTIYAHMKELRIMVSAYTAAKWSCIKEEIGESTKLTYKESKVKYKELREKIEKQYHE